KVEDVEPDSVIFNIMVRANTFRTASGSFMTQDNAIASFFRHSLLQETQGTYLSLHTDNDRFLKRIVKHLCQECYLLPTVFCDFATGIFQQLLCYLMLSSEVKTETLHLPDRFSIIRILHDIQENFDTVTLKTLAQKYFFSEEYLSRLIKKHTGRTFSETLLEIRISQAKLLLARTNEPLEAVGNQIGYREYATFSRAFKKKEGCTPACYRQEHHE
ncbi:MAG: helix-turn-helix transcriptional regulator, partial [Parasporobacterium sp.]|nr:helix-turn-helix transcriptional regulator [Parasporobacterium sp.]